MSKPGEVALVLVPVALVAWLGIGLSDASVTQTLFVHTTYFFLMATVLCWVGTYLHVGRALRREAIVAWVKENWPGLVVAALVTVVAGLAVQPALRILSDEAGLVGTSKNLFASRTATFTVSGKNYFDSTWDIDVAIDRRPALFPFLVSLIHVVRGYTYRNAFLLNLLLVPAFVLVSYRLAKSLGGETFGLVASLLVAAHPITLISARSGGFDFLALFFSLLIIKSLFDHVRAPGAASLATLWMNLCMFAEVRYESALFILPVVALLLVFRLVNRRLLAPHALIYALTPAYLAPRIWQAALRGSVPDLEPGVTPFGLENFFSNAREYFKPVLSPLNGYPAHAGIVIALGLVGCVLWLAAHRPGRWAPNWTNPRLRWAAFVGSWMLLQAIIVFSYGWGRAQSPSAARLFIAIDTFFSFFAAWALAVSLRRWRPFTPVLIAAAVFAMHVPIASQHRFMNRLTQTREMATVWRFFDNLHEKRILIVADRPELFTIMDYGAMGFEAARQDRYIFDAFARHLFYDIYVVQQIRLSTNSPAPGYDIWPQRRLETMLEFQNDADILIRISRLGR
ncbi:MAG TPA: hypothetical protein VHG72_16075 [Polyangia bacterium]|nr:hypothetical protein [Polyangia bacterium]